MVKEKCLLQILYRFWSSRFVSEIEKVKNQHSYIETIDMVSSLEVLVLMW